MKILFLDQFSDLGGAQKCLLDLLPAVRDAGWEAHLAAPGEGPLFDRAAALGATTHKLPLGRYRSGRKSLRDGLRFVTEIPRVSGRIRELMRRHRADLVYVNGPRLLPAASRACRKRPLLFHCHNCVRQRAAAYFARIALRRATATVVSCCRFSAEPLREACDEERMHIVANGVAEAPERDVRVNANNARIGMLGRISAEKGQLEFLKATRLVADALPHCRFVIAGDVLFGDPAAKAYYEKVREAAEGLPLQFAGWQDDAYGFMRGLDVLLVPSVDEPGMPRVVLEAQACGLPVIAFATGGIPEAISDGETGFLVTPASGEELGARLLSLLLHSPDKLQSAARAGRESWRERFTLERFQRRMLEMMELAAGRTAPRMTHGTGPPS